MNEMIKLADNKPRGNKQIKKNIATAAIEILAIFFWGYALVKVFIFDADIFLINNFAQSCRWIIDFKFFIILIAIATVWLFTKNEQILLWSIYVFFYPLIIIFWKIPYFIFRQKSWNLVVAFINSIVNFFKYIKYRFIGMAVFLGTTVIIFSSTNKALLWISSLALLMFVLAIYIHKIIHIFKPSGIFTSYLKIFKWMRKKATPTVILEASVKNLPLEQFSQRQLERWSETLQTSVLFNRVCFFAAKKLKDYQNSSFNFFPYVLTILFFIIITVISFAIINYGLFKIDSNFFDFSSKPSVFIFTYYSFNNFLFNSIRELTPAIFITQSVAMIESFFALFLIAIFISLLVHYNSQKNSQELDDVIKGIKEEGASMEKYICDEYKINSIAEAIGELSKLKTSLIRFILMLTDSINK